MQKYFRVRLARLYVQRKYLYPLHIHNLQDESLINADDKKRLMIESIQEPWNIAWAKYLVAKRRLKTVPNLRRQRLLGKKYR